MVSHKDSTPWDPYPEQRAPHETPRTFSLVGVIPEQTLELSSLFESGDHDSMVARVSEEAGLPWVNAFQTAWVESEDQARTLGLFDLAWHRRARAIDPIVIARDFAGFDILVTEAGRLIPDLGVLLAHIDPNRPHERIHHGPDWWVAWHRAMRTQPGGWLEREEIRVLWDLWPRLMHPGFERSCLEIMGASYTHPGCWSLLDDLGGFFAQCVSECRGVLAEVDV